MYLCFHSRSTWVRSNPSQLEGTACWNMTACLECEKSRSRREYHGRKSDLKIRMMVVVVAEED